MPEPIPQTFEEAFKRVQELAAAFKANERRYLASDYQEAEVRKDFIDKFWIALGWDVNHDFQTNPYEQEVKVERGVSSAEGQTRADYAFYLKPNFRDVRFYVEAKKPSVELANKGNYFQVACYGWNSGTPLAVIHDFQQFHILDCRGKPKLETVLERAVATYHYDDYCNAEKFKEIYWLFSREAVAAGSLEKRAAELPKLRGKGARRAGLAAAKPVDEDFLETLDGHRTDLARAFKKHNPRLDSETLTELAQRTLDRLVFLRFLEDKGIEAQRLVEKFGAKGNAWEDFVAASRRLDGIYNGIVFKEHAILDKPAFRVDEESFSGVCQQLTAATTPYNFNVIPIHILGSIYERFLGKVIVATDKRVRVEEKPEVRKAGGVYYTPEYIVRYIVENTVGKLVAGKKPEQIAGMRFADIACGSGSFLLGVYDLLLQHHGNYYNNLADADRARAAKRGDCVERDGKLYLSLRKKREILTNNIYGVDLDPQAVEVCQLSLYLKLLKDETTVSAAEHQMEFHETLLPSLAKNIVCGNSLIGRDISEGQLFAGDEERKLNPMNFEDAFPHIFAPKDAPGMVREAEPAYEVGRTFTREGGRRTYPHIEDETRGFDAIVGNPPYVRQEGLKETKAYFEKHYESYASSADLYAYFMERAVSLLRRGGRFGYVVSSSFLRATYAEPLRETLKRRASILRLVDFGGHAVFADAKDTYVCIPILAKEPQPERIEICKVKSIKEGAVENEMSKTDYTVPHGRFDRDAWSTKSDAETWLFEKIVAAGKPLGEYIAGRMFYGIKTGFNDAFVISGAQRRKLIKASPNSAGFIKPCRGGEDCRNYYIEPTDAYLIVVPSGSTRLAMGATGAAASEAKAWAWFKSKHAALAAHLEAFKSDLSARQDMGDYWWELRPCDYYPALEQPKIVFPDICKGPRFCYDDTGLYLTNTAYALGTGDKYLLGILNSRLFWFAISNISIPFGVRAGEFRYRLIYQYMEKIPIHAINPCSSIEKAAHDDVVSRVDAMLVAKASLAQSQTDKDRNFYEAKCASLDRQMDALVYRLYGLTAEEIAIVEGAGNAICGGL
jgi:hypothetical protein